MQKSNRREHRPHQLIKRILAVTTLTALLLALLLISAAASRANASDTVAVTASSIWLDGPTQAKVGETIAYNIVTDAEAVFGAQLELGFDPELLQVVDELGDAAIQITPGVCPEADFVVLNSADNALGTISYAATSLAPTVPCDGGIVASFRFLILQPGSTQVQFVDELILADSNGSQIPVTPIDLSLEIDDPLTADFAASTTRGYAPLIVTFDNQSTGEITSLLWTFGDSTSSTLTNPTHVYTAPGVYTVTLIVNGPEGSDKEEKENYIEVNEGVYIFLPAILGP